MCVHIYVCASTLLVLAFSLSLTHTLSHLYLSRISEDTPSFYLTSL